MFSRIGHILSHKSSLCKLKKKNKPDIISSIFSDHNAVRLNIKYKRKKYIKHTNTCRLSNMLLTNQQTTEEIKNEIKIFLETNEGLPWWLRW